MQHLRPPPSEVMWGKDEAWCTGSFIQYVKGTCWHRRCLHWYLSFLRQRLCDTFIRELCGLCRLIHSSSHLPPLKPLGDTYYPPSFLFLSSTQIDVSITLFSSPSSCWPSGVCRGPSMRIGTLSQTNTAFLLPPCLRRHAPSHFELYQTQLPSRGQKTQLTCQTVDPVKQVWLGAERRWQLKLERRHRKLDFWHWSLFLLPCIYLIFRERSHRQQAALLKVMRSHKQLIQNECNVQMCAHFDLPITQIGKTLRVCSYFIIAGSSVCIWYIDLVLTVIVAIDGLLEGHIRDGTRGVTP